MLNEVVSKNRKAQIEIIVIWIEMLTRDNESTARNAAGMFINQRVMQFHDPNRLAGKAIAESLGAAGAVAWDMYLFYSKESKWEKKPPAPLAWVHQLDDSWADKDHFAWGEELSERLHQIMRKLIEI